MLNSVHASLLTYVLLHQQWLLQALPLALALLGMQSAANHDHGDDGHDEGTGNGPDSGPHYECSTLSVVLMAGTP